jgi:hypothetical protein
MDLTGYGEFLDFSPFGPRLMLVMHHERRLLNASLRMPSLISSGVCSPRLSGRPEITIQGRISRFLPGFEIRHDAVGCWCVVGVQDGDVFAGRKR